MIYLLDDKRSRQKDYGWNESKFSQYSDFLVAIYSFSEIADLEKRNEMFNGSNVILFHESFFDSAENEQSDNVVDIRNKLTAFTDQNPNLKVVYFSGSKYSRKKDGNMAYMPVSSLYQNLEAFLSKAEEGITELEYLLFGTNTKIEEVLLAKLANANNSIEDEIEDERPSRRSFIAQSSQYPIELIFENSDYELFYLEEKYDLNVSDEYLDDMAKAWFGTKEYDSIFIPLCFGPTLSDYNGLRFATQIRCTETINQTKDIFIYSFSGYEDLIDHPYFDILKTKNVQLMDYKKAAFYSAISSPKAPLNLSDLPREMAKIKLDTPENYDDDHSIANEWAIYRWASALDAFDKDIEKVTEKVNRQLYFKYLKTRYPRSLLSIISEENLRINSSELSKVLYIDDEAEKGWSEIFCKIIEDINNFSFEHLDDEFNEKSSEQIVQISLAKIKANDIGIVILDFRLHKDDFGAADNEDITSIKLLEEIKKYNPGIQVIVFSATNKVWNLQALQDAGADAFIYKSFGNDVSQTIENLLIVLSSAIKKASWLKGVWSKTETILLHLDAQKKSHLIDKDFVGAIRTFLELSFDSLSNEKSKFPFDTAFVYYFLILEAASSQLIDDSPIKIQYTNKFDETKMGYNFQFRKTLNLLKDFEGNPYTRTNPGNALISSNKRIPYNPKFHNLIDLVGLKNVNPVHLVELRNEFSHPNLVDNRKIAQITKEDCLQLFEVCYGLLMRF